VTGYPWQTVNTPEHKAFLDTYQKKYGTHPRLGSVVGYSAVMSMAAGIKKANSTDSEKLADAFKGLEVDTPMGRISYRGQDHQSTMGAYVGTLAVKDGKGVMENAVYKDGAKFMPSDAEVKAVRAAD
jgi:branched-chain amino acid transport system substrate-binding protein